MSETLGKKAEKKIKEWLDRPEAGYDFNRIPAQLSGKHGSKNICDFTLFRSPYNHYIESKATENDRFDFSMISDYQYESLMKKSAIKDVFGVVIVLFATYQRAFILNIRDIDYMKTELRKASLNIKKIDKWPIPYVEIETVPNRRKTLLDYAGDWPDLAQIWNT